MLTARDFDPTLQRYIANIPGVVLDILPVVAILCYFGPQATSFAALLPGVGPATGATWSGLLASFAPGACTPPVIDPPPQRHDAAMQHN